VICQLASHGLEPESTEAWKSAQVTRLLDAQESWRLLFQVDSISEIDTEWADSGQRRLARAGLTPAGRSALHWARSELATLAQAWVTGSARF
jgi:hypothetical protein